MKDLLNAIKDTLQNSISYVRNRDIYVTEDIRLIRSAGGYPAIGIKDNGTIIRIEAADQQQKTLSVTMGCYVQLDKPEASIMGDPATGATGLMDMAADILAALDTTFGGLVDLSDPAIGISASEIIIDERHAIQMLTVDMQYIRWS